MRSEDASTSTTSVTCIPYAIRVRDHPQSSTVSIAREKSSGVRAHPRTGLRPLGTSASKRRGTVCHLRLQTFISSNFEPRSRPKIFWCGRYNRPQVVPVPLPARRPIDHDVLIPSGSRFEPVVSSCDGDAVEDAKPQSPPLTHRTQQTHLHLPEHTRVRRSWASSASGDHHRRRFSTRIPNLNPAPPRLPGTCADRTR